MLDSRLANPDESRARSPARPYALAPIPLRHGLTMGELALYYNDVPASGADLHVVPARGWRRASWFDETGLPWVRPSPNLPSLSERLAVSGARRVRGRPNLSVGRGTPDAFQHLVRRGWMRRAWSALLADRRLPASGSTRSTSPQHARATASTAGGDRRACASSSPTATPFHAGPRGRALLWAIAQVERRFAADGHPGVRPAVRAPAARAALMRGDGPRRGHRSISCPARRRVLTQRARRYELYK